MSSRSFCSKMYSEKRNAVSKVVFRNRVCFHWIQLALIPWMPSLFQRWDCIRWDVLSTRIIPFTQFSSVWGEISCLASRFPFPEVSDVFASDLNFNLTAAISGNIRSKSLSGSKWRENTPAYLASIYMCIELDWATNLWYENSRCWSRKKWNVLARGEEMEKWFVSIMF